MKKEELNIVITGSSSGIGKYITEKLLEKGHSIWGISRRYDDKTISEKFIISKCDVSLWESINSVSKKISEKWHYIDALIHCAGTQGAIGSTVELNPYEWEKTVNSNLSGTFFVIKAFFPILLKSPKRKKVICFSGGGGGAPRPYFSAYAVAKTGIVRLVETLSKEWENLPVDINAIAPGAIPTPMIEEIIQKGESVVGKTEYLKALEVIEKGEGPLEKVLHLIDFLLSKKSDGISGKLIAAQWDNWSDLKPCDSKNDLFTLRRITSTGDNK